MIDFIEGPQIIVLKSEKKEPIFFIANSLLFDLF